MLLQPLCGHSFNGVLLLSRRTEPNRAERIRTAGPFPSRDNWRRTIVMRTICGGGVVRWVSLGWWHRPIAVLFWTYHIAAHIVHCLHDDWYQRKTVFRFCNDGLFKARVVGWSALAADRRRIAALVVCVELLLDLAWSGELLWTFVQLFCMLLGSVRRIKLLFANGFAILSSYVWNCHL